MANRIFDQLMRRIPVRLRIIGGFLLVLLLAGSVSLFILSNFNTVVTRLEQFTNVDAKVERLLVPSHRALHVACLKHWRERSQRHTISPSSY